MKALFFIEIPSHYPTEESVYQWYKKELDNESYGCQSLAEIKNLSVNCDVILILPGFNISHKQIISKLKNRKKLELAIGYELEEVLSEEIETLFFAYQAGKEKNSLEVAIVNRIWFEQWLAVFKKHDILLTAAITDLMLLANITQDYLLIQKPAYYLLKTPATQYVIDNENINYVLEKLKASLSDELLLISDNPQSISMAELDLNIKAAPVPECLLKLLTEHYSSATGVNLLQGAYKPKLKNDWQQIKLASLALFSLLVIATIFQGYQHWQLTKKETELDQQRLKIFQTHFPTAKKTNNPLAQMKNGLETLKQTQQQQGQFINLLAKVSTVLKGMIAQEKIHLLGIEFDGAVLTVKLNANSLALIDQIKQFLAAQQLMVEVESGKAENQVIASFKISGV